MIKKQALRERLSVQCWDEGTVLADTHVDDCYADKHERQNDRCPKQELLDSTSRSEGAGRLSKKRGAGTASLYKQHSDKSDCGKHQYEAKYGFHKNSCAQFGAQVVNSYPC